MSHVFSTKLSLLHLDLSLQGDLSQNLKLLKYVFCKVHYTRYFDADDQRKWEGARLLMSWKQLPGNWIF